MTQLDVHSSINNVNDVNDRLMPQLAFCPGAGAFGAILIAGHWPVLLALGLCARAAGGGWPCLYSAFTVPLQSVKNALYRAFYRSVKDGRV